MMKNQGFNLIELVIFIVILAIGVGVLVPLVTTTRYIHRIDKQTQAIELAQQRMELVLTQKQIAGFASFTDPCAGATPPTVCTPLNGFVITTNIINNWGGDPNYKVITVDVTGDGSAKLETLVANY